MESTQGGRCTAAKPLSNDSDLAGSLGMRACAWLALSVQSRVLYGKVERSLQSFSASTSLYTGPHTVHATQWISSVQSLSRVQFLGPHELQHARPPCLSPTPGAHSNPYPLSRWCHLAISSSVSLLLLPSIFPSIRVFSNEPPLHIRWPKYWSFSFSISLSNEHPGLISFRMDCLDLLAAQRTLKSLLQYHSSKASILWH